MRNSLLQEVPGTLPEKVSLAKDDKNCLNTLIKEYTPFIKKCTSGVFFKAQARRDNLTEAMLGFIQSVKTYDEQKGAFVPYAQMVIRARLINAAKKEAKIQKRLSEISEYDNADQQHFDLEAQKDAQAEISQINIDFIKWGISWQDIVKNCPKQNRSRKFCFNIVKRLFADKEMLDEMLKTGKLPIKQLLAGGGCSEKSLEKYRRYIFALILIVKGDYPYIRSFLPDFIEKETI